MVSFNVGTSKVAAEGIFTSLHGKGRACWVCTKCIPVGVEWRTAIQKAVVDADVYVCLINRRWVDSKECQHETNMAINLHLHKGRPHFIPVVLPDMHNSLFEGVMLSVSSNHKLLMVDSNDDAVILKHVMNALGY